MINPNGAKPIYIQIADWLENEILNGNLTTDERVYSQYKLAEMFTINPATAAKGLNVLADEGSLYTKRGLGKFVTANAKKIITEKRKSETLKQLIQETVTEAEHLQVSESELIAMIHAMIQEKKGDAK